MFLNYVDSLTSWHLRILKFFVNPQEWGELHGIEYPSWGAGGPSTVLEHAFSELQGERTFYDQLVKDLFARGLMNTESLHTNMTVQGMFASRTTGIGQQFIAFITSPLSSS